MKPITFIHTADLHLGSPLKSIGEASEALQRKLHDATFTALSRIIDAALRHDVDFVLFSGDVYDLESRSVRANRILAEEFSRLREAQIPAYLIAGNHDPQSVKSGDVISLPDNVHVFGTEAETAEFRRDGDLVARILGQSYRSASDSRKMYSHFTVPDSSVWNIGMLHTALDPENNDYVPCHVDDLKSKPDIHYWALGHIHEQRIISQETPVIAYPGIPQGRDTGETGQKGCLLVELQPNQAPKFTSIPTASILWDVKEINIESDEEDPPKNLDEVIQLFREEMKRFLSHDVNKTGNSEIEQEDIAEELITGRIIRWYLTGRGEIHTELTKDRSGSADDIADTLRKEYGELDPFIWTESVQLQTGKPVPPLSELAEQSELFEDIQSVLEEMKSARALPEFDGILGEIWETDGDYEKYSPENFIMDEATLQQLVSEAGQRIVEALLERRDEL